MMSASAKRRAVGDIASTRELRLRVGASGVVLRIEGETDETPVPGSIDLRYSRPEQWAGDGAASAAQARGQDLWSTFFSGAAGLALQEADADARATSVGLTLRVVPERNTPSDLWWAPWELLCDTSLGGVLALRTGWSVVRGTESDLAPRPLPASGPLRILAITLVYLDGAPSDWQAAFVGAPAELAALRDWAARPDGVQLEEVDSPDLPEFLELLQSAEADVIHVIGTGSGGADLVVRDPNASEPLWGGASHEVAARDFRAAPPHRLAADRLADALSRNPNVGVLVLNGCELEAAAERVADRTGIAVVAHRGGVLDNHASAFTQALYPSLIGGAALDVAVADAKRALERDFPGQAAWASIVAFTGWPAPRFRPVASREPPSESVDARRAPEADGGSTRSAADLLDLLHDRNCQRLRTFTAPATEWSPIAAQVAEAEGWLSAR